MRYTIKNEVLTVEIDSMGAEVKSVIKDGREYMWCGDAKYWGRTSPVLFPFVGSVKDGVYRTNGREYPMGQHGFARDMEFELADRSEDMISFTLASNDETLARYPYEFRLTITYRLNGNALSVEWKVENPSDKEMYFSIGAHPAFVCPLEGESKNGYKFKFDTDGDKEYFLLDGGTLDKTKSYTLPVKDGYAVITDDMFDRDALIAEGAQAREISLCDPDGRAYVTVRTDAPLFGLWSPAGKNAPFVCIEPWYGRCDASDFDGELKDREFSNTLEAGESFCAGYTVEFV